MQHIYKTAFQLVIMAGGGDYVGVMEDKKIGLSLILFSSPLTGSTLALKPEQMTVKNVRQHIAEHNAKWIALGSPVKNVYLEMSL